MVKQKYTHFPHVLHGREHGDDMPNVRLILASIILALCFFAQTDRQIGENC
jgi:hypothetical protein